MGLIDRVATPARRSALLFALILLAVLGSVAVWITRDDPWAAVILAVVSGVMIVVVKGLLEVTVGLRSRSAITSERAMQHRLDTLGTTITSLHRAVDDRIKDVESVGRRQEGFNDAVLDRVRSVESVGRRQEGFNDAVLDRVRRVESAATKSEVLGEELTSQIEQIHALLESIQRYRDQHVGTHLELELADELGRLRSELDAQLGS